MAKRTADLIWVPENRGERELPPSKRTARPPALPLNKASVKELAETVWYGWPYTVHFRDFR